jgi:hypothetical protein
VDQSRSFAVAQATQKSAIFSNSRQSRVTQAGYLSGPCVPIDGHRKKRMTRQARLTFHSTSHQIYLEECYSSINFESTAEDTTLVSRK